jgi:hypothetical protein
LADHARRTSRKAVTTPSLQRVIGTLARLTELQQAVARDVGPEKTVLREQEEQGQGTRSYLRKGEFTSASARLALCSGPSFQTP